MKEETAPKGEEPVDERKPDMATKGTRAPIIVEMILTTIRAPIILGLEIRSPHIKTTLNCSGC